MATSTDKAPLPLPMGSNTLVNSRMEKRTDKALTIFLADNQFKGDKYVGQWKNGKAHGQGIRYRSDGSVFQEGIFENDKFLYAKKPSPAVTAKKSPHEKAKEQWCAEIGFKKGSEKFGDCVEKIIN